MKKIVVIGGGGHAKVVISAILKQSNYEILGYIDSKDNGSLLNVSYLGCDDILPEIKRVNNDISAVLGIGFISINKKRQELQMKLEELGFELPVIISPGAIVNKNVEIGKGTVVLDRAVINVDSKIGDGVIINTGAIVEHDCTIGGYSHIAPGTVLCGGVSIGSSTIIGAGSTVIQYKKITDESYVGAGSLVVKDCLVKGKYFGNPARLIT